MKESKWTIKKGRDTSTCKRNIDWLLLACPYLRTWPITQACALTVNQTGALSFGGEHPTHWATSVRADSNFQILCLVQNVVNICKISYVLEKNVYSATLGSIVLYMLIRPNLSLLFFFDILIIFSSYLLLLERS